jgi:DnaJ-class molecular chaperone
MVRLDLDRMEARHALRSLRRTMEIVLNLTETEGETEEDRRWRYVSYGMADAKRLADALETAIGPEQTLGCPECNGYRLGEAIDTCGSCGGRGCGECIDGAVQVQVPCDLCGGEGEIPESLFD